jgi:hypothetical protein
MKNIAIIFVSIIIMSGSCEDLIPDQYYFIRVKNNSPTTIIACGAYVLPDTLLPIEPLATTKILSGRSNVILDNQLNDKRLERFKKEKVTIFIIDEKVYCGITWDSLRRSNRILKRFEISEPDLSNLNWILNYP